MILLPFVFGFIFILTLLLKLVGGPLGWWVVILFGALFILPVIALFVLDIISRIKRKLK